MAMTYTISGENNGLDFTQLRKIFKDTESKHDISFTEVPVSEKAHISFGTFKNDAIVKGEVKRWNYDPLFFKQKTAIKNTLGEHHQLINKSELYNTIKKLIPNGIKYLPKSYNEKEIEHAFNNNTIKYPLIVKKDNVPQQQAIRIVLSKEEYYKAIKELGIKNDAMASEYITNPLLIDGKKFHLRILFLLSVISGITRCSVFPVYRVRTAELPYINGDYLNDKIHLTGGHNTTQLYEYPEDLKNFGYDINTIEKNLNACNKTICIAMTMANVKNYPESYAGYHIYGADIMITDDYCPYLLEINSKPGFTRMGDTEKGYTVEYVKHFSHRLFSFILNTTVFPTFGIVRPPIYDAEFIGNGQLTPYANILTGGNKYYLIPLHSALPSEIKQAEQIHFFHKGAMFDNLTTNCNPNHIFLIKPFKNDISDNTIIGYIVINEHNKICASIAKEYQNRGIGTAMVAQLLDFCRFRFATLAHSMKMPTISTNNMFMNKINKKILNIKKSVHSNHLLTYQINSDEINSIFHLDKYMKQSNSQFVSFLYHLVTESTFKKNSTGSKYDSNFIYQGAELKSTLNAPLLFNIYQFKKALYKTNTSIEYLDKKVTTIDFTIHHTYTIYDYSNHNIHILTPEHNYDLTDPNYLIEEYYPPYLIDGKLMCLRFYLVIYISRNKSMQFYLFPKNIIVTAKDNYDLNQLNKLDVSLPRHSTTHKIHKYSKDLPSNDHIQKILKAICADISTLNIKPYSESNAGFLEYNIDIKFIKKHNVDANSKYIPILHKIFNYNGIHKKQSLISDEFIEEYYQWLNHCIILPHFGLHGGTKFQKLIYGEASKIHLEFNMERTMVHVYDNDNDNDKGIIKLDIKQNEIYIIDITANITKLDVISILMEKLAAYYAPIIVSLIIPHNIIIKHKKEFDTIAFELEFAKKSDYYIHKC
jgi:hypothetical protein